jgi:hypothetical protein
MKRAWGLGGLVIIGLLGCMVTVAVAPPTSAHVAPPDSAWVNDTSFLLLEVFGPVPRTGTFDINSGDPSLAPITPFGFTFEGIATVDEVCTDQVQESGGHAEAWLADVFTGADAANVNAQLRNMGLLQHDAQVLVLFTYGASLRNGSFGTITQCAPPVGDEGLLLLSIYAQQTFDQAQGLFLNGELLHCSLDTTWADPNSVIQFCNPYYAFSNTSF